MADKAFGVDQLDILGSGTPTISAPNQLNLDCHTVAISTSVTVGANLTVNGNIDLGNASSDTISLTGVVDTNIIPSADSSKNIGSNTVRFANGYFDTVYGDGSNLTNLPASGISTSPSNVQATWKLGGGSGSGFTFTGPGQDGAEGNPDIYLVRGQRYLFDNTTLAGNHPFEFRNAANDADYTDGVSGAQNGLQYINVQHDAPAALKYRCTIHTNSMLGNIYIVGQHLANGADNRILTATSAYGMNGEANLTFDGTSLDVNASATAASSEANTLVLGHGSGNYVGMTLQCAPSYPGSIFFTDTDSGNQGQIVYNHSTNELRFYANGSQKLVCKSDGVLVSNGSLYLNDSIIHNGDTNTKIRFPDADTFSVETGGSERLRIDSSGHVTVNSTSYEALTVTTSENGTNGPELSLVHNSASPAASDSIAQIRFKAKDSAGNTDLYARIHANLASPTSGSESGDLVFGTRGSGTFAERLRITSNGSLLLGTTTDLGHLTVSQAQNSATSGTFTDPHIRLDAPNTTDNVGFSGIAYSVSSLTNYGWTAGAQRDSTSGTDGVFVMRHHNNSATGNERLRLEYTGSVKIKSAAGNSAVEIIPTASASTSLVLKTWQDNSGGRNWAIRNRYNDHGRLEFMRSTTNSNDPLTPVLSMNRDGNCSFSGSLSKASGSFKIDHPLPSKTNTHHLVHSFVESPQANNIYRGKVDLVDGTATVNIDTVAGMSDGTFVLLNREIQCFTSNETGWVAVKGSVSGNILTITSQENTCTDTISWMVIGERKDKHMYDTDWTDENGKVIVEPLKETDAALESS